MQVDWKKAEELLAKKLDPKYVSMRKQAGATLSYLEGWHVADEMNRIFGHGGWSCETVYNREVCSYRQPSKTGGENVVVGYESKVRISVGDIVKEGTGYGSGISPREFDAYESAGKEAETDAFKRAAMKFGHPLGLALYDKNKINVAKPEKTTLEKKSLTPEQKQLATSAANNLVKAINASTEIAALDGLFSAESEKIGRFKDDYKDLYDLVDTARIQKINELNGEQNDSPA